MALQVRLYLTDVHAEVTNLQIPLEIHGDEEVTAVDMYFSLPMRITEFAALIGLEKDDLANLYVQKEGSKYRKLKSVAISKLVLDIEAIEHRVEIGYGLDNAFNIPIATIRKFAAVIHQEGMINLSFKVRWTPKEEELGTLAKIRLDKDVDLTIHPVHADVLDKSDEEAA